MGNPRKPRAVKEKQDTLEKSREPENPVQALAVKELHANGELLNDYAKKEWKRITKGLGDMGILYEVSQTILLMYCNSVGMYFQAMDEIKLHGFLTEYNSNKVLSAHVKVANDALEKALKISVKFGLTPADMDKLNSPTPPKEDDWIGK